MIFRGSRNSGVTFALLALLTLLCLLPAPARAQFSPAEVWEMNNRAGLAEMARDELARAEEYFQIAIETAKSFGPGDHRTYVTQGNLARVYQRMGRLEEAEALFSESATLLERRLGGEHILVGIAYNSLGDFLRVLGRHERAEAHLQKAAAIYEKIGETAHGRLALAWNNIGLVYRETRRLDEAEAFTLRAHDLAVKTFAPESTEVATILNNLGVVYSAEGKVPEAIAALEESVAIARKLWGETHSSLALPYNNLGSLHLQQANLDKAAEYYETAARIYERALGGSNPNVATVLGNLAEVEVRRGNFAEAEPVYRRALEIQSEVFGPDHLRVGVTTASLALVLAELGKADEAVAKVRRGIELQQPQLARGSLVPAQLRERTALTLYRKQHFQQARLLFEETLAIRQELQPEGHPDIGIAHFNVATTAENLGDTEAAVRHYTASLAIEETLRSENGGDEASNEARNAERDVERTDVLDKLGNLLARLGRPREAAPHFQRALELRERRFGPEASQLTLPLFRLAQSRHTLREFDQAEALYRRVLTIQERQFGPNSRGVSEVLNSLGNLYFLQSRFDDAEPAFRRALEISRGISEVSAGTALHSFNLASTLARLGPEHMSEAEQTFLASVTLQKEVHGDRHPMLARSHALLAEIYASQKRQPEAVSEFERAIEIKQAQPGPPSAELAKLYYRLGRTRRIMKDLPSAEQAYRAALAIEETTLGREHATTLLTLQELGGALYDQGRYAESIPLLEEVLTARETDPAVEPDVLASTLSSLAHAVYQSEDIERAAGLFDRLHSMRVQHLGGEAREVGFALFMRGRTRERLERYDEALQLYQQLLVLEQKLYGETHTQLGGTLRAIGRSLCKMDRCGDAIPYLEQAKTILDPSPDAGPDGRAHTTGWLGIAYARTGRTAEAEPLLRKAIAGGSAIEGFNNKSLIRYIEELAKLLRNTGRAAEATQFEVRATDLSKEVNPK